MNWADQEALKIMSQRGKPGPRLIRGVLWAVVAIFIISILTFVVFTVIVSVGDFVTDEFIPGVSTNP